MAAALLLVGSGLGLPRHGGAGLFGLALGVLAGRRGGAGPGRPLYTLAACAASPVVSCARVSRR
ncbi:hypothetical protein, partial [Streptomyces albidoflavus]|uniref:hypothetical protein n=1 Tax=Streptomyces albidoflavus TaxID=1886 RepID=UPI001C53C2AC